MQVSIAGALPAMENQFCAGFSRQKTKLCVLCGLSELKRTGG